MKAWRIFFSENEVPTQSGLSATEFPRRSIDIDPETVSLIYTMCQHGQKCHACVTRSHTYVTVVFKKRVKLGKPKIVDSKLHWFYIFLIGVPVLLESMLHVLQFSLFCRWHDNGEATTVQCITDE